MGKAVYLPFAVYVTSDLAHPVHQVLDHSSLVDHSIDLDFGIAVDLVVEVRFLDALVDPTKNTMAVNIFQMKQMNEMTTQSLKQTSKTSTKYSFKVFGIWLIHKL